MDGTVDEDALCPAAVLLVVRSRGSQSPAPPLLAQKHPEVQGPESWGQSRGSNPSVLIRELALPTVLMCPSEGAL